MSKKTGIAALLALLCCAFSLAAQAQRQTLNIVMDTDAGSAAQSETYLTVKKPSEAVRVYWVETRGAGTDTSPKNAHIFYSSTPNGGDTSMYTRVNNMESGSNQSSPMAPGSGVSRKGIRFIPAKNNIGAGVYYCIIAYVENGVTYYSNYFELKVASPSAPILKDPKGLAGGVKEISDLTPSFSWEPVENVPYYHVILSDEKLPFDSIITGGALNLNLSIVWQAITPNTRITYGAPDPSNTITAAPPPLSPGKEYSWLVFNNYGNHVSFSDGNAIDIPGAFRVTGNPLRAPKVKSPVNDILVSGDKITFKWYNLDTTANSYLVNLFVNANPKDLGMSGLSQLDTNASANMLVWETAVLRGGKKPGDTLSVELPNASGTLTGGHYQWRVYALDRRGAATTDASSKGAFRYEGVPQGRVGVTTFETVGGVESGIGYVELRSEVISGPMQAPLAFYTNAEGYQGRDFPEGTYRITAVKDGYNTQTVTFSVTNGNTTPVSIYMRRPDAVIYGRVAGPDSAWVNLAKVTAVSEWGDTVTATTNSNGNFTLNCREADWTVAIEKAGYRTPRPRLITLRQGADTGIGTAYLEKNPNTLSGVVRNSGDTAVVGAKVRVLKDGVLVEELTFTPENGAYSFSLPSGTYTLTAEKPGFVMYSRSVTLTGSRNQDITMAANAALINGMVFGRSWNPGIFGGGYDVAPIPNAKVTFIDKSDASNTYTVASDATYGKFSVSVPGRKTFTVKFEAAGFVDIAGRPAVQVTTTDGQTITFDRDTLMLQALAMISGTVVDEGGGGVPDVDVIVYDAANNRVAASAKSSNSGGFEIRNIPDGEYIVNAGKNGYYLSDAGVLKDGLSVSGGSPEPNFVSYKLTMGAGEKTITWDVVGGYNGRGAIKVTSPLNKTIPFSGVSADKPEAILEEAGPGDYVIEAVAEANPNLLQLSYHKFNVSAESESAAQEVRFPWRREPKDTIKLNSGGIDTLEVVRLGELPSSSSVKEVKLFHRSEGSTLYDSTDALPGTYKVTVRPDRDGCDLQYYFRVELSNGDVYGSPKQIFTSYAAPSATAISRVDVNPGSPGDTLYLPSSYAAQFELKAFYSDLLMPFNGALNVSWYVNDVNSGGGRAFTLNTGGKESEIALRAELRPSSGNTYTLKSGVSSAVEIPIMVTGSALESMAVVRNGGSGPVFNTEKTSFRVEALDKKRKSVTVSPVWDILPATAGDIGGDGLFEPKPDFFGVVRVHASAGGKGAEYTDAEAKLPGLSVNYLLRSRAAPDTASTHRGLRLAFSKNSIPAGESVELRAVIHSTNGDLKNGVHRGSGGFRMADSLSYDVEFSRVSIVDSAVIIIDVPAHLTQDAVKTPDNFKVARWYPDSLKWIVLPSSEVVLGGTAVAAVISGKSNDNEINARLNRNAKPLKKAGAAKANEESAEASELHASARYALVVQNLKLSVNLTVSPNPFSPYIHPIKEYGKYYTSPDDVPEGTCVRVSVEAPDYFVRSLKVHIYNATGKRVWAIDRLNAKVGENRIWWDGRTTSREEVWKDDNFIKENKGKGRMCRNGRYFVTAIVTDMEGRQVRVRKPLVLMK